MPGSGIAKPASPETMPWIAALLAIPILAWSGMLVGKLATRSKIRHRRLPPGYKFEFIRSEAVSPKNSSRVVLRLLADDGVLVLKGSVLSVGQYDAVEVVDYCVREVAGDIAHADTHTMTNIAWQHYKIRVGWWHRNVTQYATTWAVVVALLLGLLSLSISLSGKPN